MSQRSDSISLWGQAIWGGGLSQLSESVGRDGPRSTSSPPTLLPSLPCPSLDLDSPDPAHVDALSNGY